MFRTFCFLWAFGVLVRGAEVAPPAAVGLVGSEVPTARVYVVQDAASVDRFRAEPEPIRGMVERGLMGITGKNSLKEAWRSLVAPEETLGIKVHSAPGALSGTRPAVVAALVESLIRAEHPKEKIVIWDKSLADLRRAGFVELGLELQVRVAGAAEEGWDDEVFYDSSLLGKLVHGDHEFKEGGEGRKSFLSKLVSKQMQKIVQVSPLLNHNVAGVSGNLWGLALGSVDNALRFETSSGNLARAVPEIYALPELADRAVLHVVDGLICQYQGGEGTLLHYSAMLGELRFSVDPVALDALSIQELERQRKQAGITEPKTNLQLYENAEVMDLGIADLSRIQVIKIRP